MKRTLALAALTMFWTIGLGSLAAAQDRPLFEPERPAPAAGDVDAAAQRGTEVLEALNAGYFHFDPKAQFEAACAVKKDGQAVGKLQLKFFCPGKFQVDFVRGESAGDDDWKVGNLFRDAIDAAMIEHGLPNRGFKAKLQEAEAKWEIGGSAVAVPAKSQLLSPVRELPLDRQTLYVISPEGQLLQYARENEDNRPGIRGEGYTVKSRKIEGKYYVESVERRTVNSYGDATPAIDRAATEFTYMKKDGVPFIKRLQITHAVTKQGEARPASTVAWVIEVESVTFKKDAATTASPAPETVHPARIVNDILRAYRDKDVKTLAKFAAKANQKILAELADQGDKHPRYNSLFGGWRMDAMNQWGGKWDSPRYVTPTEAIVPFLPKDDEFIVLTLVLEDGQWRFQDINRCARDRYDKAAEKP